MRILIPSIQVPFINGGAESHVESLKSALEEHGHDVEIVRFPFQFFPESQIEALIQFCMDQDFNYFNGYRIDRVISLQFPAYYVQHDNKNLWIMHQHRVVYDLYDQQEQTKDLETLKKSITNSDNTLLGCNTQTIYANSKNVASRLKKFNNIDATPLYHPPANIEKFFCEKNYGFIFYPSRLEKLKRQDLLIKAMQYTRSKAVVIIAGDGGQLEDYKALVKALNLSDKISLIGHCSEEEKYILYARSLGVFFAPYDEDYGYITLEAMLSSKPVITCTDSGGPLEFVLDKQTGFVVVPDPKKIAEKIDWLYDHQEKAKELGAYGLQHYHSKDISWDNVIKTLLEE